MLLFFPFLIISFHCMLLVLERERERERERGIKAMKDLEVAQTDQTTTTTGGKEASAAIFNKTNRPVTLKFEDGITGIVLPGEMLAMLGPSGSGKTTLLTALGGRLRGQLTGTITYNGEPFSNIMKRNTGFVTQDDVLYPHLTVTETLVFAALLRLPNNFTKLEKMGHAEAVISQLGLTRCKNCIIGGPFLRGVSGAERKRVSIGHEMLINPSLLFLDEPTSGLDSTTAQRIVSTLSVEAMDYFSSIGYGPSVAMNPSDFLLDLATGISSDSSREDQNAVKQTLVSAFKTNIADKLKSETHETGHHHGGGGLQDKQFERWNTTWWQQFSVLLRRGVKERKHQAFSFLKIGQVLVVSFLAGLLWWQSDISHLQDQIGLLFFTSEFWSFYSLFEAIFMFPQERKMLAKERSSGMYRLSSYFMARTVGDLPMELVLPTAFLTITYWMAGLKPTAVNFCETLFVLLYSVLVSQGLGLALGALIMDQKSASTLGGVIMLSFHLTGGFYVQHVPKFIAWIKYISISQYTYKLLLGSQYKASDTYPCAAKNGTCLAGDFPSIKLVGLDRYGLSVFALGIILLGYRIVAYIALMGVGVTSK
ncbi:unnamed protein product [Camellia sinensis]